MKKSKPDDKGAESQPTELKRFHEGRLSAFYRLHTQNKQADAVNKSSNKDKISVEERQIVHHLSEKNIKLLSKDHEIKYTMREAQGTPGAWFHQSKPSDK